MTLTCQYNYVKINQWIYLKWGDIWFESKRYFVMFIINRCACEKYKQAKKENYLKIETKKV